MLDGAEGEHGQGEGGLEDFGVVGPVERPPILYRHSLGRRMGPRSRVTRR